MFVYMYIESSELSSMLHDRPTSTTEHTDIFCHTHSKAQALRCLTHIAACFRLSFKGHSFGRQLDLFV